MPDASEFDQILVLRNGRIEERISEATPVGRIPRPSIQAPFKTQMAAMVLNAEISVPGQVPLFSEMDAQPAVSIHQRAADLLQGEDIFHQVIRAMPPTSSLKVPSILSSAR